MKKLLIVSLILAPLYLSADLGEEDIEKLTFSDAVKNMEQNRFTVELNMSGCTVKKDSSSYLFNWENKSCVNACVRRLEKEIISKITNCNQKSKCQIDCLQLYDYSNINLRNIKVEAVSPYTVICSAAKSDVMLDMTKFLVVGESSADYTMVALGFRDEKNPDKPLSFKLSEVELAYLPQTRPHFNYKWILRYKDSKAFVLPKELAVDLLFKTGNYRKSIEPDMLCKNLKSYSGNTAVYNNCVVNLEYGTFKVGKSNVTGVFTVRGEARELFADPMNTIAVKKYENKKGNPFDLVANIIKRKQGLPESKSCPVIKTGEK